MRHLVTILALTLTALLSSAAFSGGWGHNGYHRGMHHGMDYSLYHETLDLTDEQQALLSQLESAQVMLQDMMTNVAANSLDENGDFDRSSFHEQMSQNQLVIDDVKSTMKAFHDSLSEEQIEAMKAAYKAQKEGCRDKHDSDD